MACVRFLRRRGPAGLRSSSVHLQNRQDLLQSLLYYGMLISPSADDPTHIFTVFLIFQLSEINHYKSIPRRRRQWHPAYAASRPEASPASPVRQE